MLVHKILFVVYDLLVLLLWKFGEHYKQVIWPPDEKSRKLWSPLGIEKATGRKMCGCLAAGREDQIKGRRESVCGGRQEERCCM